MAKIYTITYEVSPRDDGWAVVKVGIRGGTRHVATYPDVTLAERVAETLNQYAIKEL